MYVTPEKNVTFASWISNICVSRDFKIHSVKIYLEQLNGFAFSEWWKHGEKEGFRVSDIEDTPARDTHKF